MDTLLTANANRSQSWASFSRNGISAENRNCSRKAFKFKFSFEHSNIPHFLRPSLSADRTCRILYSFVNCLPFNRAFARRDRRALLETQVSANKIFSQSAIAFMSGKSFSSAQCHPLSEHTWHTLCGEQSSLKDSREREREVKVWPINWPTVWGITNCKQHKIRILYSFLFFLKSKTAAECFAGRLKHTWRFSESSSQASTRQTMAPGHTMASTKQFGGSFGC